MRRITTPGVLPIHSAIDRDFCWSALRSPLWGQTGSLGTVTGVVTDPSNAVVPDATVTIKDKATNSVQTLMTNSSGRYMFLNVKPGDYEVTVTKTGFSKVSIPSDMVEVGTASTNNVTLKIGSESQTVEVQANGRRVADLERHGRQHGERACA